jgi:L-fuculose-phosphate aldolase
MHGPVNGVRAMVEDVREQLAMACRILSAEGHEHFHLGHVSARETAGAERFWVKAAGLGLGEVRPANLVLLDLDGKRLAGDGPLHQEMSVHTEIYRRRPDVLAVVHTHPFHVAALAATGAELRMVSQDSIPFASRPARYDSALLITTQEQGRAVADALADGSVVILRNHGIVVADASIEGAVYLAVALERSVRLQLAAAALGEVREIEPDEVAELRRQLGPSHDARARGIFDYLRRSLQGPDS